MHLKAKSTRIAVLVLMVGISLFTFSGNALGFLVIEGKSFPVCSNMVGNDEMLIFSQLVKKFPHCMEPKGTHVFLSYILTIYLLIFSSHLLHHALIQMNPLSFDTQRCYWAKLTIYRTIITSVAWDSVVVKALRC